MPEKEAPAPEPPSGKDDRLIARVTDALSAIFSANTRLARMEAKQDLERVLSGALLLIVAGAFACMAFLLMHVVAVIAIELRFARGLAQSIGVVLTTDMVAAAISFRIGRARLAAPLLAETRALVTKLVSAIRG